MTDLPWAVAERACRAWVRVFWGFALLTGVPAGMAAVMVAVRSWAEGRLPAVSLRELPFALMLFGVPVLFAVVAEGVRRAARWAVPVGVVVALLVGVAVVCQMVEDLTDRRSYHDARWVLAVVVAYGSLAGAKFLLAVNLLRSRAHLPYLREYDRRGGQVRAFEPVMGREG